MKELQINKCVISGPWYPSVTAAITYALEMSGAPSRSWDMRSQWTKTYVTWLDMKVGNYVKPIHLLLSLLASLWACARLVLTVPERHLGFIGINALLLLFAAGWEKNEAWRISNISLNPGLTHPPAN